MASFSSSTCSCSAFVSLERVTFGASIYSISDPSSLSLNIVPSLFTSSRAFSAAFELSLNVVSKAILNAAEASASRFARAFSASSEAVSTSVFALFLDAELSFSGVSGVSTLGSTVSSLPPGCAWGASSAKRMSRRSLWPKLNGQCFIRLLEK